MTNESTSQFDANAAGSQGSDSFTDDLFTKGLIAVAIAAAGAGTTLVARQAIINRRDEAVERDLATIKGLPWRNAVHQKDGKSFDAIQIVLRADDWDAHNIRAALQRANIPTERFTHASGAEVIRIIEPKTQIKLGKIPTLGGTRIAENLSELQGYTLAPAQNLTEIKTDEDVIEWAKSHVELADDYARGHAQQLYNKIANAILEMPRTQQVLVLYGGKPIVLGSLDTINKLHGGMEDGNQCGGFFNPADNKVYLGIGNEGEHPKSLRDIRAVNDHEFGHSFDWNSLGLDYSRDPEWVDAVKREIIWRQGRTITSPIAMESPTQSGIIDHFRSPLYTPENYAREATAEMTAIFNDALTRRGGNMVETDAFMRISYPEMWPVYKDKFLTRLDEIAGDLNPDYVVPPPPLERTVTKAARASAWVPRADEDVTDIMSRSGWGRNSVAEAYGPNARALRIEPGSFPNVGSTEFRAEFRRIDLPHDSYIVALNPEASMRAATHGRIRSESLAVDAATNLHRLTLERVQDSEKLIKDDPWVAQRLHNKQYTLGVDISNMPEDEIRGIEKLLRANGISYEAIIIDNSNTYLTFPKDPTAVHFRNEQDLSRRRSKILPESYYDSPNMSNEDIERLVGDWVTHTNRPITEPSPSNIRLYKDSSMPDVSGRIEGVRTPKETGVSAKEPESLSSPQPTRQPVNGDKSLTELRADIEHVGPRKPMGYMLLSTIEKHWGPDAAEAFARDAQSKGLKTQLFRGDEPGFRGSKGVLTVWDEAELQKLLDKHRSVLTEAGWPTDANKFAQKVYFTHAPSPSPMFDLVADAFADYSNTGRMGVIEADKSGGQSSPDNRGLRRHEPGSAWSKPSAPLDSPPAPSGADSVSTSATPTTTTAANGTPRASFTPANADGAGAARAPQLQRGTGTPVDGLINRDTNIKPDAASVGTATASSADKFVKRDPITALPPVANDTGITPHRPATRAPVKPPVAANDALPSARALTGAEAIADAGHAIGGVSEAMKAAQAFEALGHAGRFAKLAKTGATKIPVAGVLLAGGFGAYALYHAEQGHNEGKLTDGQITAVRTALLPYVGTQAGSIVTGLASEEVIDAAMVKAGVPEEYRLGTLRQGIMSGAHMVEQMNQLNARKVEVPAPVAAEFINGLRTVKGPTEDLALNDYLAARDAALSEAQFGRPMGAKVGNMRVPESETQAIIDNAARTYIAMGGTLETAQFALSENPEQARATAMVQDVINLAPSSVTKTSYPSGDKNLEQLKKLKLQSETATPDQKAAFQEQMTVAAAAFVKAGGTAKVALVAYYHAAPFAISSETIAQLQADKAMLKRFDGADGTKPDLILTAVEIGKGLARSGLYNPKLDSDKDGKGDYPEIKTAALNQAEFQAQRNNSPKGR